MTGRDVTAAVFRPNKQRVNVYRVDLQEPNLFRGGAYGTQDST